MNTTTVLLIIMLCIGAIQGVVFGITLLRSGPLNKVANSILAILLFLLSYQLIVRVMRLFGLGYYDSWYYVMLDYSWITGALIYFYTKAQIDPSFKFSKKDWKHLIPLFVQVACSIFVRIQNLYWDGTRESLSWLGYWGYAYWMNKPTISIIASGLIIYYASRSEKLISSNHSISSADNESVFWIRRILMSFKYYFMVVLIILVADLIIFSAASDGYYFYFERFYYYPFFMGLAVLTYWLGIAGFIRRDQVIDSPKKQITPDERDRFMQIAQDLNRLMKEEHLYKIHDLSVDTLAKELDVKPYLISKSLNEIMDKRFTDYINDYRVAEARRLINDPANQQYTLLSIAMDAGFNSKSSFHRAVKKRLGVSPSELKDLK